VRGPTSKGKGVKERGREKEGEGNGGGRENLREGMGMDCLLFINF